LHLKVLRATHAMPDFAIKRERALRCRGCGVFTWRTFRAGRRTGTASTRNNWSTGRHLRARQCGALRRARHAAVVAETEAAPRRVPLLDGQIRILPAVLPGRRTWRPMRRSLHDESGEENGNIYVDIHGGSAA